MSQATRRLSIIRANGSGLWIRRRGRSERLRYSLLCSELPISRELNSALFLKIGACYWIAERRNLLIMGASGLDKSWLACALG
ncbi:MAG: hypothetical protein EXR05_10420 [Acetobacteraceae bacterium]|nr:hypothetical protein [Acetobacteraceae bacterium]MSP30805.1 hypothetical protein [Acetobacteraceae bacterium]